MNPPNAPSCSLPRSSRQPGQDTAPAPAPRLRKGSDAPWPSVPQRKDEAPKPSGAPPAGVGSAGEPQAQASPQEGTEAQGARPGPGLEDGSCRDSLGGQKAKVEERAIGDRPDAIGVDTEQESGVKGVNTKRSEVIAGEAEESSEVSQVGTDQQSEVRHVDTKGPEATGLMSEARFKGTPEAPPRGSQGRSEVRIGDESPTVQSPHPAEPGGHSRHLSDSKGVRAAVGQEREGTELRDGASGVGRTGLVQGPSVGAASTGPQVSRYQGAPPAAEQGVMSRNLGAWEAETGDSKVLGTETRLAESEVLGTQETEAGGSGFPKIETRTAEAEILGAQETEGAGLAESEELVTQKTEVRVSGTLGTETGMAECEVLETQKTEAAGSGVLGTKTKMEETEILGTQETYGGSGVQKIEAEIAESTILAAQEREAGGSGVLEIEAGRAEAEILGTWETELGGSEAPGFETKTTKAEVLGTQEKASGGSVVPGKEIETARTQETEAGGSGVSGPEAGRAEDAGLGTQQTETIVLEAEKAMISGVPEAETRLGGTLICKALRAPVTKYRVLESQGTEVETVVLRVQEAEAGVWGVSEAKSRVLGAQEAEMEVSGPTENQSGIFEAQEAEAGVSGTEKGKEAEGSLPEASLTEAQVASGAGTEVPSSSGTSSPEEPEEDRRLPGSQVGMGAAEGPVFCFPLTWAELTAALHGPTWSTGVGWDGLSFKEPPHPFLSGCPGSPTLSFLGCMELDISKLIFWADLRCGCW